MSVFPFLMPRFARPGAPHINTGREIHTTAITRAESKRKQTARNIKKANLARRAAQQQESERTRPNMLTGINSSNKKVWAKSILNQTILDREKDVWQADLSDTAQTTPSLDAGLEAEKETIDLIKKQNALLHRSYNFGLTYPEVKTLIDKLPWVSVSAAQATDPNFSEDFTYDEPVKTSASGETETIPGSESTALEPVDQEKTLAQRLPRYQVKLDNESEKLDQFARILDLRNANGRGIRFENTRRVIEAVQTPAQAEKGDTGSPQIQAAVLTTRILLMQQHVKTMPKDFVNQRNLVRLVQQRRRILKYLKRKNLDEYEKTLRTCGIDRRALEGELILTKADIKHYRDDVPELRLYIPDKDLVLSGEAKPESGEAQVL